MKRLASWALPIVLGVAGVGLIILGATDPGTQPGQSLPEIARPSPTVTAAPSQTPGGTPSSPAASAAATPAPTPSPLPDDVVAEQIQIPSVGINILVRQSTSAETDAFPPHDAAYILRTSSQPGRQRSSYIFAHAENSLFKPLWNVLPGAEVRLRMSDGSVLLYVVTEVRPNVACPDPDADPALNPPNPPLALQIHDDCSQGASWLEQVDHERLTLQTSQGYNRNWGELVVVAEPAG